MITRNKDFYLDWKILGILDCHSLKFKEFRELE